MKRTPIVLVAVALSFAVPAAALACGNPVMLAGSKAAKEIKRAEAELKAGRFARLRYYQYSVEFRDPRLQRRADIIAVTARVRLQHGAEQPDVEEDDLTELRTLLSQTPDDPLLQARLAEALVLASADAAVEGSTTRPLAAEAKTLLEDLATRDLITESDGWAALATVKMRAGDTAGRDAALARCKKVVHKSRKNACRVLSK